MTSNLSELTNAELKRYLADHRKDEEAFRAALQVLISRRDPNAVRQPYPFDLANPESEVEAVLREKFNKTES